MPNTENISLNSVFHLRCHSQTHCTMQQVMNCCKDYELFTKPCVYHWLVGKCADSSTRLVCYIIHKLCNRNFHLRPNIWTEAIYLITSWCFFHHSLGVANERLLKHTCSNIINVSRHFCPLKCSLQTNGMTI